MAIQINLYENNEIVQTLKSIGRSDDFEVEPDNRMELVKTIPVTVNGVGRGATIADGGYYSDGDRYMLSAVFDSTTYEALKTLWEQRTAVEVVFEDGSTLSNAIIVIKGVSFFDKLLPQYKKVKLEIWKDCRLWL